MQINRTCKVLKSIDSDEEIIDIESFIFSSSLFNKLHKAPILVSNSFVCS